MVAIGSSRSSQPKKTGFGESSLDMKLGRSKLSNIINGSGNHQGGGKLEMREKKMSKINSDQELAEEMERHHDDIRGWESGPSRATVRRGTVVFSLRLSADELETLRDRAETHQMSVSDVIRQAVFANAISVSIPPVSNAFIGTGIVLANSNTSGVIHGGYASNSAVCASGPFPQMSIGTWNNVIVTTCATPDATYTGSQIDNTVTCGAQYWCSPGMNEDFHQNTFSFVHQAQKEKKEIAQ
jgi:hypothetical protein